MEVRSGTRTALATFTLTALVALAAGCSSNDAGSAPPETAELEDVDAVIAELQAATPAAANNPVGLSLWFEDGAVRKFSRAEKTVDLYEDFPRYMQEIDVTAQVVTTTDQGITPVVTGGDMATLDWRGIHQTDEDWRPEGNPEGTYTRSRFYRGARWMNRSSVLAILPLDNKGWTVGLPILEVTGKDDDANASDGAFVRRFVARQVVQGCRAIGDCSNATAFTAQALMQYRDSLHAAERARRIPDRATKLGLFWSEDPTRIRTVPVRHRRYSDTPYRHGFDPQIQILTTPANGQYFAPGEGFDFRVVYRDGAGTVLNLPGGLLPSYAEFTSDTIDSGVRYYDGFRQVLTVFYALKHREGNNIWAFAGPTNKLKTSSHVVPLSEFFTLAFTQIPMATRAEDG